MWITSVISTVTSLFTGSSGFKWIATVLVLVVLLGGGAYLWHDYQGAKARVVDLESKIRTVVKRSNERLYEAERINKKNEEAYKQRERQLEKDLENLRGLAEERKTRAEKLSKELSKVKKIKRPDHEKNCPLHPATVAAIDILRERQAAARNCSSQEN